MTTHAKLLAAMQHTDKASSNLDTAIANGTASAEWIATLSWRYTAAQNRERKVLSLTPRDEVISAEWERTYSQNAVEAL